jgi:hypothetical protein
MTHRTTIYPAMTRAMAGRSPGLPCAKARRIALPAASFFFNSLLFSLHLREIAAKPPRQSGNVIARAARASFVASG